MTKKFQTGLVVLILVAIIGYVAIKNKSVESENTNDPQEVRIGFPIQSLDATPIIVADQKGFFKEQGLNVKLMHLQSSEGALAVGSGEVDIDVTGAARLFGQIGKGVPVKLLSIMSDMSSHLFVRPGSDIITLKDLEGKKVSRGPAGANVLKFT